MQLSDYPGVASFTDARGNTRYRYRGRDRKTRSINAEPHTPKFDRIYRALVEGRDPKRVAEVVRIPGAAKPETFDAAYRLLRLTAEWQHDLEPSSRAMYALHIEEFLDSHIEGTTTRWGAGPVVHFKRRHAKQVLARQADRPHKEKLLLICLRKLILVAMDQEWQGVEHDPTYGIKKNPEAEGHRAWPAHIRKQYEDFWPVGSVPRTAYTLALWMGNRRSDVALLRWDQLTTLDIMIDGEMRQFEGFDFTQYKGRNRKKGDSKGTNLFLPLVPMLAEALAPLPRDTETVLTQERRPTKGYNMKSLTQRMARWTEMAGLPKGYRLHGLRKTLGAMLAECDATTRQLMDVLGHSAIAHAELYSRSASQKRLAVQGMEKVVRMTRR